MAQGLSKKFTISHTDESKSKPSRQAQDIFTPEALLATILPILGLEGRLKICWLAHP